MSSFPRSVELKLNRSAEQAQLLKSEIDAWSAANPIRYKIELSEGNLGFRIIHEGFLNPPPTDRWSLIFGECIHNLRSALDNLAWGLACANKNPPDKPAVIKFPIYDDKKKFEHEAKPILKQLSYDVAQVLTAMQPFEQVDEDPKKNYLVTLQSLSNEDKHRVPVISFTSFKSFNCLPQVDYLYDEDKQAIKVEDTINWDGKVPLQAGTILLEHKSKYPLKACNPLVFIELCFSVKRPIGITPVEWLANYLVENIRPIIKTFDAYFALVDKRNAEKDEPKK